MMKRMILFTLVLLLPSSRLIAQLPPQGYIGIFADDSRSVWCVDGVGFYQAQIWIWCLPSERGQICVEFGLNYPSNVIQGTITLNDTLYNIAPWDYFAVCYRNCQYDWHWIWSQQIYVLDSEQTAIEITVHEDSGVCHFTNCEPGYPTEPCTKYTNLYINYPLDDPVCSSTSVQNASWGAVKSIYLR